jgi:hypothetical protein
MPRPARKLPSAIADRWKKKRAREEQEEARWESLALKKQEQTRQVKAARGEPAKRLPSMKDIAADYISGTHGSLPAIDYESIGALLSDDFVFENEEQRHNKDSLLRSVYPGWASIIKNHSAVRIHSIAVDQSTSTVLAHWETDYDCCDGAMWYGTDVDISGRTMRSFQVFASFSFTDSLISKIVQRSDSVVKRLGIEDQVRAARMSLPAGTKKYDSNEEK